MTDIPDISTSTCDSCGITIQEGEFFYHCRTEIIAGKNHTRLDLKHPDRIIAEALANIGSKREQELLDDIYQEIILQLCPECRTTLLQRLHSMISSCKSCAQCHPQPKLEKEGKLLQFPNKKGDENK